MLLTRILEVFLLHMTSLVFCISTTDQSSQSQSSITGSATDQSSHFQSSVMNSATDQPFKPQSSVTGAVTLAGLPNPTESPIFGYKFQLNFGGGRCSISQQNKLRQVFNNMAGLADRIQLWKTDAFFDWSNDVNNWLGSDASKNEAYIKNNALRLSAAVKPFGRLNPDGSWQNNGGDVFINTYLYVGCNYDWGNPQLTCNNNKQIKMGKDEGRWGYWDNYYWNVCPNYWTMPTVPEIIEDVTENPSLNIHYMENYETTMEFATSALLYGMRSIGINAFETGWAYQYAAASSVWKEARIRGKNHGTDLLKRAAAAYYFAAMAITVPEAFNRDAYPLVPNPRWLTTQDTNTTVFQGSGNNIFNITDTANSSTISGAADPLPIPYTDSGSVSFSSLVVTIHTEPPQCFSAWSTAACDCGPLTGSLTVRNGKSSCVVAGATVATVALQNWATVETGTGVSPLPTKGSMTAQSGRFSTIAAQTSASFATTDAAGSSAPSATTIAAEPAASFTTSTTPAEIASSTATGPQATSHNHEGSSACDDISHQDCINAFQQYENALTYHNYTSYVYTGSNAINEWLGGKQGCTATFSCDTDDDYSTGMDNIKSAFQNLYTYPDVNICGTSYLSNGCAVTLNMCDNCVPYIPCFALSASDVQAGRPCYGQFQDGLSRTCVLRSVPCRAGGICSHSCECSDKSKPTPFVEPELKLYTCPDVAGLPDAPPGWPFV